jgi:hypothetical protein
MIFANEPQQTTAIVLRACTVEQTLVIRIPHRAVTEQDAEFVIQSHGLILSSGFLCCATLQLGLVTSGRPPPAKLSSESLRCCSRSRYPAFGS